MIVPFPFNITLALYLFDISFADKDRFSCILSTEIFKSLLASPGWGVNINSVFILLIFS